jgi:nucleotide-binding universal stress UspA family protein
MFNKVLSATDMVSTVDAPVVSAARLARQHDARLHLLHVLESASTDNRRLIRHFETGEEMLADANYAKAVHQALATTYREPLAYVAHDIRITVGFPWQEILIWAKTVDSDVILLGPHSSRAEEKGVVRIAGRVGSTVENVITRETCPVMIVNQAASGEQLRFRRILVSTDFSRSCESAVCFAARLATRYNSQLAVFHMLPVPPVPKYTHANYVADEARTRRRLESAYQAYLEGIDHRYLIRAGALPHLEILGCAAKENMSLIVMGSHTKESSGKWYPGSVVERVGYRSACPVVVITDPAVLQHWEGGVTDDEPAENDRLIHIFTRDKNA